MAFTQFTNLDFDQIKISIKDYLRSNSTFSDFDFEGSNLSILIDVLAYNTYLTAFNTNMVVNESFIDSATLRENVISLARNIGYVPLSRRAATATITFSLTGINSTFKTVTLKKGIVCTGNLDNTSYIFSVPEDITVGISRGEATFENVTIYEGTLLTKTFTVDTSQPNQKYILPNPFIDTSTIRVSVKDTPQSTTAEEYLAVDNIVNVNSTSRIFLIQEISDEKYELFFGDGIFGKKLSNNNQIVASYITTNGKDGNGASDFVFSGSVVSDTGSDLSTNIGTLVTIEDANNGDDIQSIESVRYYAPRMYSTQYRAVTAGDYEALLPTLYPNIESVTAYGGEELSPPQFGKVFLAAKPKNSEYLSQATKDRLLADLKKYTIAGIQPEFVDINVLYVELDSTVYYNSNFIGSASDLKAQITQSLETYSRSSDLNKFGGRFKYSKALRLIDVTNTAITSNITKVRIRRNVGVLIDQPTQYLICFENRFAAHSEAKLKNIRTTGFTLRGFNSICYVGDKPNSNLETGILYVFTLDGEKELVISENIGTIDYIAGEINIDNIEVTSTVLPNNIIEIEATPYSNDIIAKKSIYLELDVGKSDISVVRDIISSGENTSGSRFTPESSFITETNIRS
jgi:hypothetical protein